MSRIEVPVHVVVDTDDPVMHPDMLRREVVERLHEATLTQIVGSGHLLPLERPEDLTAVLRGLL